MGQGDFLRRMPGSEEAFSRRVSFSSRFSVDIPLLVLLLILTVAGLFVLYSASGMDVSTMKRQISFFVVAYIVDRKAVGKGMSVSLCGRGGLEKK